MGATYISVPFTAANGTAWDSATVGLLLAEGTADVGTVQANAGQPGADPAARVYTTRGIASVPAYQASALLTWAAPGVDSLTARLGLRVTQADAANGYFVDLDSNAGAPRLRIRRRVANVETDVLAWQALTGVVSADLAAGVTLLVVIENRASAVRIIVRVNAVDQADVDDSNAARINAGGCCALGVPALTLGTEVLYDTLVVQDLAGEQTSWTAPGGATVPGLRQVDATGDVVLTIQGRYADLSWMRTQRLDLVTARASWDLQPSVRLRDRNPFHQPLLAHGAHVTVSIGGTVVASGRLRGVEQQAYPPEGTEYEVACPKELAQDVLVLDPRSGSNVVTWNVDEKASQYDPLRQDKTIADVLTWIATYMGDELRAVGAAPASGDIIQAGALSGLTAEIPNLSLSGDVTRCVESLLRYAPKRGWRIDPDTLVWSFPDRSAGTQRDIDIGSSHVLGSLGVSPKANYTRVLVTGQPKPPTTTLRLSAGDIQAGWDTALNATYNRLKAFTGKKPFTITAFGGGGVGIPVWIEVDRTTCPLALSEWRDAGLVISTGPAAGEYRVRGNTASTGATDARIVLNSEAWVGAAPVVGNTGYLGAGFADAKGSAYAEAFRAFNIPNALKGTAAAACYEARIITTDPSDPTGNAQYVTRTRAVLERYASQDTYPPTYKTRVVLDTPAVKPAGATPSSPTPATEDACADGGTHIATDVEIDIPLADLDSVDDKGVVAVPTLLVPAAGYRGSAYAVNPALWDGGGEPGLGDMGCRRTLVINDPQFDGSAAMVTAYTTLADDMLAVLGTLARQGTFRIAGLVAAWADITQRVTLSDSGGRTTGYEASDDLWVIGVEWDVLAYTTTVYVGTLVGAGGYDIQAVRDEFASRIKVDSQRRDLDEAMRLQECLRNKLSGGYVGAPDPSPLPDCQIATTDSLGRPTSGSGARLVDESCTPVAVAPPGCIDFPCGTVADPAPFIANAASVAKVIHDERTAAMDDIPAGERTILDAVCCAFQHISALWASLGSGLSAVDHELHKTFQNLGTIRTQTAALTACVNSNFTAVQVAITCLDNKMDAICAGLRSNDAALSACLATKAPGASAPCPLPYSCPPTSCDYTPTACTWVFTETVCDPVDCAWTPPTVNCL